VRAIAFINSKSLSSAVAGLFSCPSVRRGGAEEGGEEENAKLSYRSDTIDVVTFMQNALDGIYDGTVVIDKDTSVNSFKENATCKHRYRIQEGPGECEKFWGDLR
jgi:hypothetical protein